MGKPNMFKKRGFIGPLGDDIPAIFPIVAGVLIFITSLIYIYGQVDERNKYLEIRTSSLKLSYIVSEKGLMDNDQFAAKCEGEMKAFAKKKNLQFLVLLKKYCDGVELGENKALTIEEHQFAEGGPLLRDLICSSKASIEGAGTGETIAIPETRSIAMSYPIAVQCGEGLSSLRGLGMVTVAMWQGKADGID